MICFDLMKKTFNILIFSFFTLAIGFWGEIVELSNDELLSTATEMCEKVETEDKAECISHVESFEKISKKGQGGSSSLDQDDIAPATISVESPFSLILVAHQNFCSNSLSVKAYNEQVSNSIHSPKFYILYHCTKSFLS
jgi:hypothetical protein